MNKELLKAYGEITKQIKDLEEKQTEVGNVLLADLVSEGLDKVQEEFGTFSVVTTKKFTFSDAVKEAETRVKELKEEEKTSGKAIFEESSALRFQLSKK